MGMYDTFHAGTRHGQTKALGKSLAEYLPGDRAQIIPAPMDEESYEAYLAGEIAPVADSAQVVMMEGGFLTLRDGVIEGWVDVREPSLPLFDYLGRAVPEQDATDPDRERALAEIAGLREGVIPEHVARLAEVFGTELTREELAGLADEREAELRGEPGDCRLCAAVRAGEMRELRAAEQRLRAYQSTVARLVREGMEAYDATDELPDPPAPDAELMVYSWREEGEDEELSLLERLHAERRALEMRAAGLQRADPRPLSSVERFRLAALQGWAEHRRAHAETLRAEVEAQLGPEPEPWVSQPQRHLSLLPGEEGS